MCKQNCCTGPKEKKKILAFELFLKLIFSITLASLLSKNVLDILHSIVTFKNLEFDAFKNHVQCTNNAGQQKQSSIHDSHVLGCKDSEI